MYASLILACDFLQFLRVEAVGVAAVLVEIFPNTHAPLLEALGSLLATSCTTQNGSAATGNCTRQKVRGAQQVVLRLRTCNHCQFSEHLHGWWLT